MAYKAIIAGASGLIGSNLLRLLLQQPEYDEVLLLVRKEFPVKHKKLKQAVINFDTLEKYSSLINGHALFSCLGTTKEKTPDTKIYYKIDHDYSVMLAQLAAKNGVTQFHLVSSVGANANSSQFYLKTKGETERDVQAAGVKTLHIYQPSLLTGRTRENRFTEDVLAGMFAVLNPLLVFGLKKYRSVPGAVVARAMITESLKNEEGIFIHPSNKIKELA
ncbi:MAG: NAD-dependent epimerase/dehydratase family protein [Sphingobacteriales bacterium]|nr:MAG: NAD-dependent epimerase/dehydratase family protein [Sphingobacteriales bacterium]